METMERIISWYSQTSFYQRFCVNLPVPFNNAYFDVVFLIVLGVIEVWMVTDRIHSLRFWLRIQRKKESALERQLEQEAKDQERNRQMEAINQNNLLYMQFLQTAMISHMAISEPAFEAWKRENGFVSLEQAKPEIEPAPETIIEDVVKEGRIKVESNGARGKEVGQKETREKRTRITGSGESEGKESGIEGEETADIEIKDAEGCGGQEKPVNLEKSGNSGKQSRKWNRTQGNMDFVIECTAIEQDLGDVPNIEIPVLLEDECVQGMDSAEGRLNKKMLTFDALFSDHVEDNTDNVGDTGNEGDASNEGSSDSEDDSNRCDGQKTAAGITERQSTFDMLMENMVRMEAVRKEQSSMQEEANKVISHNISVLDGQIQSALQVEDETDEDVGENGEVRRLEALEAERRRIEKEGSKKHFWRKRNGD